MNYERTCRNCEHAFLPSCKGCCTLGFNTYENFELRQELAEKDELEKKLLKRLTEVRHHIVLLVFFVIESLLLSVLAWSLFDLILETTICSIIIAAGFLILSAIEVIYIVIGCRAKREWRKLNKSTGGDQR